MPKPSGDYYCALCALRFEDNYHLQRHLSTSRHTNTLLKQRGITIDEVDMDEIVNINILSKEELKQYIKNTERFKELTEEVIAEKDRVFDRVAEISKLLGDIDYSVEDSESDDGGDSTNYLGQAVKYTECKLSTDEICDMIEEREMLLTRYPSELAKAFDIEQKARETVLKELKKEYELYLKAKDKRLEVQRKEAERQADKDRKEAEKQRKEHQRAIERQQENIRKEEDKIARQEFEYKLKLERLQALKK
jgi:hypothetical protein